MHFCMSAAVLIYIWIVHLIVISEVARIKSSPKNIQLHRQLVLQYKLPWQMRECLTGHSPVQSVTTSPPLNISTYNLSSNITQTRIKFSDSVRIEEKYLLILRNVLTLEECENLIKAFEESGQRKAYTNRSFTTLLWTRISSFIPSRLQGHDALGIWSRLSFSRKDVTGQYESNRKHIGRYLVRRDYSEFSILNLLMYLNKVEEGGDTVFLDTNGTVHAISPLTGSLIIFSNDIEHHGTGVIKGQKYILNGNIMFRNRYYNCN